MQSLFHDLNVDKNIKVDKRGLKREVRFVFPAILSTLQAHCYTHNVDYDQETHKLPTGGVYKTKCNKCMNLEREQQSQLAVKKYLEEQQADLKNKEYVAEHVDKKVW